MSVKKADALLEEATAFIAVAESGDAEQSALEQAAIRIEHAMRENPELTQTQVAQRIGKTQSYVGRLLQALMRAGASGEFRVDWHSGASGEHVTRALKKAKPEKLIEVLQQAIEDAPPEQRQALVEAVTDTSTVAGRHVTNTVVEKQKKTERREPEPETGLPITAYMASMVVKMNEWANGLSVLVDDLDELPEGHERDVVADAAENLEYQAHRWVDKLRPGKPHLRVIENRQTA